MSSYHLSVKTIKRSAGRSATAAAYRAADRIECQREGRVHDYTRKQGIEETFILAPEGAPDWVLDRSALWNAAEAAETRRNSVTAREWELALPSEISAEARSDITREFAQALERDDR
ncbi:MobA/MobL family protein [Amaricoccus tamworthensis]|uniref:MobA/MobL family protein n=1 Tax=Amaricoccus tamworthensis TaxID=57002 RepID=UPI003C7CA109